MFVWIPPSNKCSGFLAQECQTCEAICKRETKTEFLRVLGRVDNRGAFNCCLESLNLQGDRCEEPS